MASAALRIMMVGDLVLDEPQPDRFFDDARPVLKSADVLIGHVEVPHTTRGKESVGDVPAPGSDPANLAALKNAGFHLASLAGNHVHDRGAEGIADTIATLKSHGIDTSGAGPTLADARKPAFFETKGRRVALLSYNCVGPRQGWASSSQSGCAHVRVISHYEMEAANPGGPPEAFTFPTPETIEAMQADIEAARRSADIAIVSLHKGLVHQPAKLAMYERPVARAAIDAGADIVFGHHAHILKGVEVWRGKPIFHGLGNFVTVTRALNIEGNDSPARRAWAIKRRELFGFAPLPDYPLYPFHPEARNAMIAVCDVDASGQVSPGFIPCWMQPSAAPLPLGRDAKGEEVAHYVEDVSKRAGLRTQFTWDGERVVFAEAPRI
jgi:poly-gamma-glutamate capsule biosynthesis protein CapA/YwtB (metallophosphatase superfamily)